MNNVLDSEDLSFHAYKRTIVEGELWTDGMGRWGIAGEDLGTLVTENIANEAINSEYDLSDEYVFDIKVDVYRRTD